MAEKTLVYRINFDGLEAQAAAIGKVDNELTTLNQTIKRNRADLVNLTELNDQGTAKYRDLTDELGRNIVQQRNLTKAKGDLIRETQNEAKVLNENEGSIVSLRAQLSNLTKEYNNLTRAERESAKGKDVQNQAKAISDELKKLESAVGNTSRNVGNYKEALGELETSLKQLLQAQAAARKSGQENNAVFVANEAAIQALAEEYQILAKSEKEVDNQLKALTQTENEAGASAESLKSKLRALKEAAAVAGEGTEDFKRLTAEAGKLQDKIEDANEAIKQEKGTEFEKFREQLGGVGQSLGNLDFKQANERIAQLGTTLKGLTFSSLKDGLKGAASSFTAFGKVLLSNPIFLFAAVVAAVGIALFALKDKIKIIGDAFDAIGSTINGVIQGVKNFSDAIGITSFKADAEAKKLSEDALKRYNADKLAFEQANEDKIRAIEAEIAIQKSLGKDVTDLEIEKRKQIQLSFEKELKVTEAIIKAKGLINANTAEETKRLREIGIELDNLNTEITVIENNRIASQKDANDKKLADQKKYNDNRIQNETAAQGQLLKLQQENDLALIDNEFDRERQRLENQKKADLASVELLKVSEKLKQDTRDAYNEQYKIAIEQLNKEILDNETAAQFELNQSILEGEKLFITDKVILGQLELQGLKEKQKQELDAFVGTETEKNVLLQEQLNARNALIKQNDALLAQQKFDNEQARIETEILNAESQKERDALAFELLLSTQAEELASFKGTEEEKTLFLAEQAQQRNQLLQTQVQTQTQFNLQIAQSYSSLFGSLAGLFKENAALQKAATLFQIGVDTAKSISAGIAGATTAASATGPAAFVATPLFIATTITTILGAVAQATAALKSAPKFQYGGIIGKFAEGGNIPMGGGFITGNSHANGGVKFSAGGRLMEAEGGEIIVNKGIQKRPDFVRAISQMNYMTGGKKFETGGIVAPVFSAAGASLAASEQNLGGGFTFDIPPIQVLNNVVDTTSQQSSIIQIQNQTTIGG
jgi:hypothetical protein